MQRPDGLFFCFRGPDGPKDSFHGAYGRKFCPYDKKTGMRHSEKQAGSADTFVLFAPIF